MKSVLILTAAFGEGHNAAARNIKEAIAATDPSVAIALHDVFQEAYKVTNRLTQKAYLATINHAPLLWSGIFNLLHHTPLVEWHMGLYQAAARRLEELIRTCKPDVVISTYPGCNHLLDYVYKQMLCRPFKTITVITDSLTINAVWHRALADYFIVANEASAEVIREAGVPEKKIRVFGFPVPTIFAELSKAKADLNSQRGKVLYMVNSRPSMAPAICRELLALPGIDLSVTVGRNTKLQETIQNLASQSETPCTVYGWTPEMPRLMAESHILIGKAGGATVQETLAARTPMIITQIVPGQEEGNARLILENHAGALAPTPETIAAAVKGAFADSGRQWTAWHEATAPLSHPSASLELANFLKNLP
jgi:processive 1,2-diacylglycerol beta-glucosyltransferase